MCFLPQLCVGANGTVVDDTDIDEDVAQKLKEIVEGEIQAKLKHIDRKHAEQGSVYHAETIESYPGISFQTTEITIDAPYRVLYHHNDDELEAAGKDLDGDSVAAAHLNLLLEFIHEEFTETIKESENLKAKGLMSYPHLWTIFRLGMVFHGSVFG